MTSTQIVSLNESLSDINQPIVAGQILNVTYFDSPLSVVVEQQRYVKEVTYPDNSVYTYDEDFLKNPIKADIFCTGSDQVWNSDWHDEIPKPFYLSFVPDAVPKIAFSASFGKSELADWEKEKTKDWILQSTVW